MKDTALLNGTLWLEINQYNNSTQTQTPKIISLAQNCIQKDENSNKNVISVSLAFHECHLWYFFFPRSWYQFNQERGVAQEWLAVWSGFICMDHNGYTAYEDLYPVKMPRD